MKESVEYYISELLFLYDCVIVPEFGGFVGNRKSAQLNKTTGALIPPSKQILFNPNLKTNDGLLSTYIADQEGISQNIVKENLELFAKKNNTKLSTSKVLRLAKIGLFSLGREGNIIFLQDSSINYSLESFGMKPTYNKSIIRKAEIENQVKATVKTINITNRSPKNFLRVAAIIIPLIALSYLSISQQEKITSIYTQMATFNPFNSIEKLIQNNYEKTLEIETVITKNPEAVLEEIKISEVEKPPTTKIEETIIPETPDELITPVITPKKNFYIIAGAFSKQKNAKRLLNKLRNSNYNAEILKGRRLMRVSYDSFYNREDAILALNKIKQKDSKAWLLTK